MHIELLQLVKQQQSIEENENSAIAGSFCHRCDRLQVQLSYCHCRIFFFVFVCHGTALSAVHSPPAIRFGHSLQ